MMLTNKNGKLNQTGTGQPCPDIKEQRSYFTRGALAAIVQAITKDFGKISATQCSWRAAWLREDQ